MLVRSLAALLCTVVVCPLAFGQRASATATIAPAAGAPAEPAKPAAPVSAIKVTQIDIDGLRKLIKPDGRPRLINFWATWCPPCTDEFPDLVKIDADYRGKIDVVTISLDELSEIERDVPKFLAEMKAEMPAYLLHTKDEGAAIRLVSRDWAGNLPMTVLYDSSGAVVYSRMGRIRVQPLRDNIDKVITPPAPAK